MLLVSKNAPSNIIVRKVCRQMQKRICGRQFSGEGPGLEKFNIALIAARPWFEARFYFSDLRLWRLPVCICFAEQLIETL